MDERAQHARSLVLVPPELRFRESYRELVAEIAETGENFVPFVLGFEHDDFDAMLARLADCSRGVGLPDGFVPHSTWWLLDADERVVGVSNIRHALTPELRREGGSIGYGIRPSARGRGYGTQILRLSLLRAADLGLREVLLTCAKENIRSARAIRGNGGLLEAEEYVASRGEVVQRYRIPIAPNGSPRRRLRTSLRLLTGEPTATAELQRVLAAAPTYTELVTGAPPGPADAQSTSTMLPEGKSYDDKFVFAIYHGERMVGCADLIAEPFQGQGIGRAAYRALEDYAQSWGTCDRMRLGVVRTNDRVLPFWSRLGFVQSGEVKPYQCGKVRSEVVILTKPIGTPVATSGASTERREG